MNAIQLSDSCKEVDMRWLALAAFAWSILAYQVYNDVARVNALRAESGPEVVVIDKYSAWNTVYGEPKPARRIRPTKPGLFRRPL